MFLYHLPRPGTAPALVAHGFRDEWGYYLTNRLWRGVWLSDVPLELGESFSLIQDQERDPETLIVVDLDLQEAELASYEWVDFDAPYREFLLPAEVLNQRCRVRVAAHRFS